MPKNPQLIGLLRNEETYVYDPMPIFKEYKSKIRLMPLSRSLSYDPVIVADMGKTQAVEGAVLQVWEGFFMLP
jgi:hypothetical protein